MVRVKGETETFLWLVVTVLQWLVVTVLQWLGSMGGGQGFGTVRSCLWALVGGWVGGVRSQGKGRGVRARRVTCRFRGGGASSRVRA